MGQRAPRWRESERDVCTRPLGEVAVKGKQIPTEIFALLG